MARLIALLSQVVIVFVSLFALSWWLATACMRIVIRWMEQRWPLRKGSPGAVAAFLLTLWLLVSGAIVLLLVCVVFPPLLPGPAPTDAEWILRHWPGFVWVVAALLSVAPVLASGLETLSAWGASRRRRHLTDLSQPAPGGIVTPPPPLLPHPEGRRIVIFCDGTSNSPDQTEDGAPAATNVWKLFRALESNETQVIWYQAGVGSNTSTTAQKVRGTKKILDAVGAKAGGFVASLGSRAVMIFEAAFGAGISEGIDNGYREIVRQYRPGDRIYLVGFSRGAYTARCIAGVISRCGLLRSENLRYTREVVQLYRTRSAPTATVEIRPEMIHADVSIEFMGNFDSVASLGAPLWGWWFRILPIWKNLAFATDPASACRHVYHALSMDERRSQFFPALFSRPPVGAPSSLVTLDQRWFRGVHGDVGGGYASTALSDIPLGWMMDAMKHHGLVFQEEARSGLRPDPLGRMHDELERKPYWKIFGSWPRWHEALALPLASLPDPASPRLHASVLRRAANSHLKLGRPDLRRLRSTIPVEFDVEARREWDRTGFVIETGVFYELTYLGGQWRDAEQELASASGQEAAGWSDIRRLFGWSRRRRNEPWLQLVGTVAHPREWLPHERGLLSLLRLLLLNDPPELQKQLASFGRDLGMQRDSIFLRSDAPAGLLYLYANDLWQTASNNSGAIRLTLARVSEPRKGAPLWMLDARQGWSRREAP